MKKLFALAFMALIVNSANAQLGGLLKNMATSAASSAATTVTGSSAVGDSLYGSIHSLLQGVGGLLYHLTGGLTLSENHVED